MGQHVVALILAAGSSRRMGGGPPKQLLPLGGRPVLRWCCETLVEAGVAEIVVVHAPGVPVPGALLGLRVKLVVNHQPGSEMADSLLAGLGAVESAATAVVVCLADHPLVTAATIRALLEAHRARPAAICLPVFRGRVGHPALFPLAVARELAPGRTLRDVRDAHQDLVHRVEVGDAGILFDMDTPDDYRRALRQIEGRWFVAG